MAENDNAGNICMQQLLNTSRLLGYETTKQRREVFTICQSAITPAHKTKQCQLSLLLQQDYDIDSSPGLIEKHRNQTMVSALKQNVLVQFILNEWKSSFKGKLRLFNYHCTYKNSMKMIDRQNQTQFTEAYSLTMYGSLMPMSICCRQLVCFRFVKLSRTVLVLCLEPTCPKSRLEQRPFNQDIFHSIFLAAQNFKSTPTSQGTHQNRTAISLSSAK